jgi:hypothetical protein
MKNLHTPGPWESKELLHSDGHVILMKHNYGKSRLDSKGEFNQADARLIAAAPTMLAALENSLVDPDDDHARELVEQAIALAKGGV